MCTTYQHSRCSEHVREGIVDQIQESRRVQISVPYDLTAEKRLPTSATEQGTHHAISQVHFVRDVSYRRTQL